MGKSLLSSHILKEVIAITVEKGSPGLEQLEAIPENRLNIVVWVLINTFVEGLQATVIRYHFPFLPGLL